MEERDELLQFKANVITEMRGIILFDPSKIKIEVTAQQLYDSYLTEDHIIEMVKKECWFGGIQDPMMQFDIKRMISIEPAAIAFRINRIWVDDDKIKGDVDIFDTDCGKFVDKEFAKLIFVPRVLQRNDKSILLVTFDIRHDFKNHKPNAEESKEGTGNIFEDFFNPEKKG
jgi:hypothetical protein